MSDWAVGDLAVCLDASPCRCCGRESGLELGKHYTVTGIRQTALGNPGLMVGVSAKYLNHVPGGGQWRFRKILPDKHKACETEFVTLLQRIKRKQVA